MSPVNVAALIHAWNVSWKESQRELTKSWFFSSGWKYFPLNPGIKGIIQRYYCFSELKNDPIFSVTVLHAGHASVTICSHDFWHETVLLVVHFILPFLSQWVRCSRSAYCRPHWVNKGRIKEEHMKYFEQKRWHRQLTNEADLRTQVLWLLLG